MSIINVVTRDKGNPEGALARMENAHIACQDHRFQAWSFLELFTNEFPKVTDTRYGNDKIAFWLPAQDLVGD